MGVLGDLVPPKVSTVLIHNAVNLPSHCSLRGAEEWLHMAHHMIHDVALY